MSVSRLPSRPAVRYITSSFEYCTTRNGELPALILGIGRVHPPQFIAANQGLAL